MPRDRLMTNPPSMKSNARSGSTWWLTPNLFPTDSVPADSASGFPTTSPRLPAHDARFFLLHAWLPLAAFAVLAFVSMALHGDQWLADRLYEWQGHRWSLRHAFLTQEVIHLLGRDLSTMAWLGVLAAWIVARSRDSLTALRRPLAYLALATLLSTALVAWVKTWSNMDCPWDLLGYGGERPYIGLFAMRPIGLSRGACFPAGHASGGYAWLSLYFFLRVVRPQWRWLGLAVGGGLGLLFGVSQQLRGAHFLSHDVWTAGICWATALVTYLVMLRSAPSEDHTQRIQAGAA
jgi:membrane-associated PAP2 superfamily phosphatase